MEKPSTPTVVLVHGAWADGSSWSEVVARLQATGLRVVAVQIPLSGLAEDTATVRRAIEQQAGRVVLVGHDWGGTVITQAGLAAQVVALVYIAAFAPDRAQSTRELWHGRPAPGYAALLQADSAGYLWFPQESMPHWFAQDLPSPNARLLASTQHPIRATAFDDPVAEAAWHAKPCWYLLTEVDRMIEPTLQREMALRIGARLETVASSHVPFMSRPKETVAFLLRAVASVVG